MAHTLFFDSDVLISSLLSSKGAAYLLTRQTKDIKLCISNISQKELETVVSRLIISQDELQLLIEKSFDLIDLTQTLDQIKKEFGNYVTDIDDAHIVLGAKEAKARFLITYNIKHYKVEKIKRDFSILIMTPGQFIQYLRSLQ